MAKFTAGSAVKYMVLPGLIPRIRELFFSGFSLLAYYVAIIYGMAKLIPAAHPFLNEANIGKYGLRHVVKVAWGNLDFRWKNIDRIIFFFALVAGLVMMAAYIVGSFFFLMTAPAMAASSPPIGALFTNPNPTNDIAFMMMDRILGIPGIFDSKVVTTNEFGVMPTAFHHGLHALFAYFSWGLFAIAIVMLLYFIVDVVLETTVTGVPFGKRFSNVWVPLRIVAGLGLLIPVAYGLNSAQWITLYVAKAGSNFATNAWIAFNTNMLNPMGMENKELVSLPSTPDFTGLAKDLFMIRACKDVDEKLALGRRKATATPTPSNPDEIVVTGASKKDIIDAYFVDGDRYFTILGRKNQLGKSWPNAYNSNFINLYLEGLHFYKGKDVRIVFGRFNEKWLADGKYPGGVEPVCGEVLIPNLLPAGQKIPSGNVASRNISDGMLIGASHTFAVLKMVIGISKTGFEDEGDGDEEYEHTLMQYATDRFYYQETSQGQQALEKHRQDIEKENAEDPEGAADNANPDCIHDTDNDGIDNDGDDLVFKELGQCDAPVDSEFFVNLGKRYQRYLSYGPTMGYDYYTGLGQESLNARCARIDCSRVVSGAAESCQRTLETCTATRDGYTDYMPLDSVYYDDLGQQNPFETNRAINSGLFAYGWGGAGIWYKFIAEKNGELMGSTNNLPRLTHYPLLMENVSTEKAATDKSANAGCERYNPAVGGGGTISLGKSTADAHELARLYYGLCKNLEINEHMKMAGGTTAQKTGNPALDIINALFGTKALYDFRENSLVNPMSQLAALGRALIDKSIHNIMMGAGGAGVGGLMQLFGGVVGDNAGAIGPFMANMGAATAAFGKVMVSFSFVGLTAGILLYYVIPLLPFMYFFFAVGTWAKTVFEAIVGVPLWALAHLRLDESPGFAGKAASGGYFMLLEIFIRPIVTLFALVASMFIFIGLAYVLNMTWGLVTSNLVGYDPITQASTDALLTTNFRPKIDQFFFTIIYIIFMYITATGSFKLIDQIPDGIMRWISDVKSWGVNDSADQMVENVSTTVGLPSYHAISSITPQAVEVIHKVPAGIGGIASDFGSAMKNMAPPPKPPGGTP